MDEEEEKSLLRRVKSDVEKNHLPKKEINIYVGLSEMQRKWYRLVLEKDIDAVNGLTGKKEGKTRLMNMVMQMMILDKLLASMKAKGSRVLIFSQMSRILDILEDYCLFRQYKYCRIDGGTARDDRILAIDEYNKPDSEKLIFLLTTRAGGLEINLATADIVVLYDSDWNPRADLQAMDGAHHIGQTKQVYVFRFITEGSVEERMLEHTAQNLTLQQAEELLEMITHGAEEIISSSDGVLVNDDIEEIIQCGEERTAQLNNNSARRKQLGLNLLSVSKREHKSNYSVDSYFKDMLRAGTSKIEKAPKMPRAPKQIAILAILPSRVDCVRLNGIPAVAREPQSEDDSPEKLEDERAAAQLFIDTVEPLAEEEVVLKDEYVQKGFSDWSWNLMAGACYTFMLLISDDQLPSRDQPMDVHAAKILLPPIHRERRQLRILRAVLNKKVFSNWWI
ncbi:hypothetical protein AGABI1DRAFT_133151 [Agaricus bisporus var. burnettii JB137-S8]|uniref:Helicase C-terminal domain-containing protein n=1 Tax=Agaricus bisporus var. burnettii (strain JB137-S8 / ATCC MYA-4627 / FGSC 10392) TaxID=597362 RepID=K5WUT6_AGABU|nr:uncharacterized protein AGABI1DRAFT_133151 [Agaricus bisporus var. burnettii JB137-S8]EKM74528.1 hypothetical protein AGABI1DRAFT_133151 [Agaricus bisporus var. burnettii JB137-S8]